MPHLTATLETHPNRVHVVRIVRLRVQREQRLDPAHIDPVDPRPDRIIDILKQRRTVERLPHDLGLAVTIEAIRPQLKHAHKVPGLVSRSRADAVRIRHLAHHATPSE